MKEPVGCVCFLDQLFPMFFFNQILFMEKCFDIFVKNIETTHHAGMEQWYEIQKGAVTSKVRS